MHSIYPTSKNLFEIPCPQRVATHSLRRGDLDHQCTAQRLINWQPLNLLSTIYLNIILTAKFDSEVAENECKLLYLPVIVRPFCNNIMIIMGWYKLCLVPIFNY